MMNSLARDDPVRSSDYDVGGQRSSWPPAIQRSTNVRGQRAIVDVNPDPKVTSRGCLFAAVKTSVNVLPAVVIGDRVWLDGPGIAFNPAGLGVVEINERRIRSEI